MDAIPADPPSRHNFELLVRAYLQNPATRLPEETQLTTTFKTWIGAEPEILRLMAGAPTLAYAEPRVQQLTELGTVGLEAVSYLSSGLPAPAGWKASRKADLGRSRETTSAGSLHRDQATARSSQRGS